MARFREIKLIRFPSYRVNIDWLYIYDWINSKKNRGYTLDIDPVYKRGYVWTEQQKIDYLQYVLKCGMSGKDIFWNCPGWGNDYRGPLELVDGKQRINAVLDFIDNKIKVFGFFYNDYSDKPDCSLTSFNWYVNNIDDKIDVIEWYIAMNTCGSVHTEKDLKPAYAELERIRNGKSKC